MTHRYILETVRFLHDVQGFNLDEAIVMALPTTMTCSCTDPVHRAVSPCGRDYAPYRVGPEGRRLCGPCFINAHAMDQR